MIPSGRSTQRMLCGFVAAVLVAVLPAALVARVATVTLENPGERGAAVNRLLQLDLRVQGTAQGALTASVTPLFLSAQVVDVQEGVPPAPDKKVRLTGTPLATGASSVTVAIFDDGVLQSSVTFTLRVTEWELGDVFVGVSTLNPGLLPPGEAVAGHYPVLRPRPNDVQGLGTVVIPSTGQEFSSAGLAFGCAVDPYSGLLYTTDFDTRVSVVDSVPGHAILQSLTTARAPTPTDPPTESPNYISWQPESITFGVDRRFYVGHVGGLMSGSPYVSDVTIQTYYPGELAVADDGLSTGKLLPLALRSPDNPDNQQLVVPSTPPGDVPGEPGWDYVLDFNDPQKPITDEPCLLTEQPSPGCPAPDPTHLTVGLNVPPGWTPATTPRRLSMTANAGGPDYEVLEIDPWGFLRSIDGARPIGQRRLPVIQVVNGVAERVPARRWWGKELHRYDSKAGDQGAVEATAEYFETRYGAIGTDWIDLASDQRHLYYTSETNAIYVYDLGDPGKPGIPPTPSQQVSPYAAAVPGASQLFALRLLPPGDGSGGILVAGNPSVFLVKAEPVVQGGSTRNVVTVVQRYDVAGGGLDDDGFFALSVSPDAQTFWTASATTGRVYQFRIADAMLLRVIDMSTQIDMSGRRLSGLCAKLEYTAAREPCNGVDDDGDGIIDNNCLPVAFDDPDVTTPEDTAVVIDVVANDRPMPPPMAAAPACGPDCDLTPIVVGQPACTIGGQPVSPCGELTPAPGRKFSYLPPPNFSGPVTFTYKVSEGVFESANVATVTITIGPVNNAPVAVGDSYTTAEDIPLTIAAPGVLANDTDIDGDVLSAVVATGLVHGILTLNANGSFTYAPAQNYNGADSFTYKVTDGHGGFATQTVTLTVTPVNDPPRANPDSASTLDGVPVTFAVLGNDTDVDNTSLSVASYTQPAHGTVTLNTNARFTYVPNAGYVGTDSFTYVATDGSLRSNTTTVTLTVAPRNRPPVCSTATAQPVTIWPPNHQFVPITIKGVTDPDKDKLTLKVTRIFQDEPTNTDGDGSHTPDGKGVGTATASVRAERSGTKKTPGNGRVYAISFTATDARGASCTGVVTVCVPHDQGGRASCVNDGPKYDSTKTSPALPGHDKDHCSVPDHDHSKDKGKKGDRR